MANGELPIRTKLLISALAASGNEQVSITEIVNYCRQVRLWQNHRGRGGRRGLDAFQVVEYLRDIGLEPMRVALPSGKKMSVYRRTALEAAHEARLGAAR